jgi:hypothetical protein
MEVGNPAMAWFSLRVTVASGFDIVFPTPQMEHAVE